MGGKVKIKIDRYYKYCVNCHKYSNGKPFCKYCYEKYYNISDSYKNDITHKDPYVDKIIYKKEYQENIQKTCAYCGNNSNNNEFCDDCFNKYFNYESPKENINKNIHNGYKLKNGITVRSKSELLIGNYLLKHHIKFDYESPLTY